MKRKSHDAGLRDQETTKSPRTTRSSSSKTADSGTAQPGSSEKMDPPTDAPIDVGVTDDIAPPSNKHLTVTEVTGDIFAAPDNALLIHACNTKGSWGAGIAKAFKGNYPKAYAFHHAYCTKSHEKGKSIPTGPAQLIAPMDGKPRHYIGCLFTSAGFGKNKDPPHLILAKTKPAMTDLLRQVKELNGREGTDGVGEVRICKINSGLFGVKWEDTKKVLECIQVDEGMPSEVIVYERAA